MRVLTESKGYCGVPYQLSSTTDMFNYANGLVQLTATSVEHRLAELAAISVRYRFIHFFLSLSRKLSRKRDRAVNGGGHASFWGILSGGSKSSLCWLKTKSGPQGSNGLLISWSGSMGALGISELQSSMQELACDQVQKVVGGATPGATTSTRPISVMCRVEIVLLQFPKSLKL